MPDLNRKGTLPGSIVETLINWNLAIQSFQIIWAFFWNPDLFNHV